jgi:hypothetical protein
MRITWIIAAAAALGACAGPGLPIPVRGDLTPLVGRWEGEYTSRQTGRVGSIVFTLAAGADTATGDILMIPAAPEPPPSVPPQADVPRAVPQVLRVSFVRCEGSGVSGWVEPYAYPETGEQVLTSFDGVITGDRIEGTFTSHLELSGRRTSGTWQVRRRAPE